MKISRSLVVGALVALCAVGALLAWGVASPVGSAADDDYHLPSIWCAGGFDQGTCEEVPGEETLRTVPSFASGHSVCWVGRVEQSADCQEDVPDTMVQTDRGSWDGSYPPVFYRVMSVFASENVGRSVLVIRGFNAAACIALLGGLLLALPRAHRGMAAVPLTVMSLPLAAYYIPSTNPSSWTIVGCATLFPALYFAYAATPARQRVLVALALVAAVFAAGSRADGAVFAAMIAVLVTIMRVKDLRGAVAPLAGTLGVLAISAYFFLGAGHSGVAVGEAAESYGAPYSGAELAVHNALELPDLWLGALGGGVLGATGWLDTYFPPLAVVCVIGVWAALTFDGLRTMFWSKWVGLALVAAALVVQPLFILGEFEAPVGEMVQPRYLLPNLVLLTAVAMLGRERIGVRLGRAGWLAAAAALTLANAIMLHTQIRRYVTGSDVFALDLDAAREWWWPGMPGPTVVWLLGSACYGVLVTWVIARCLADGAPGESAPQPAEAVSTR